MGQIHKQFSDDEVKQYLKWYEDKVLTNSEVLQALGIKDSRFYVLLSQFRNRPEKFSVTYKRIRPTRSLPSTVVKEIRRELELEHGFITNPAMPIMFYNYAAIRDAVESSTGHALSIMRTQSCSTQ